jgi:HD-like signal output (HDOD) protein
MSEMTTPRPETRTSNSKSLIDVARSIVCSNDHDLPVLPEVAVQLLKLTADVDCDPKDIVDLFKRDQSLTGNLLKTANSVRYTSGQTLTSIQQAVARLGLLHVREVIMMISCQSKVFNVQGFEQDVRQSFARSMAAAAFSQEIARVRRLNVEDAFLCGLLHDIGRPVLLQALSNERKASGEDSADDDIRIAAEELRIPMAGKLVLSWELPRRLSTIIEHQTTPMEAPDCGQQAAVLNLAIDLANITLDAETDMPTELAHPMLGVLNLYPEEFAQILARHTEISEWVKSTI